MKNIYLLLLSMTAIVWGCSSEVGGEESGFDESQIEMTFMTSSLPSTRATPGGSESENRITQLDLLVFKNGKFLYRRPGYKSGSRFRSTLKIDTDLTIYFITNSTAVLDSKSSLLQEDKLWETEIRPFLIDENPARLIQPGTDLPMWGYLENVNLSEGVINNLGTVNLLRSVASVDVAVMTGISNFELKEGHLYFSPNKGYIAPSATNFNPTQMKVAAPEAPSDMATSLVLSSSGVANQALLNVFYLYDNDASKSTVPAKKFTKLVLGGYYDRSTKITYYPLTFHDGEDLYRITRNNKYYLQITSVNAPGWESPEEAAQADPVNIEYEVIRWDLHEDGDIIIDGGHWVSIGSKRLEIERPAGSSTRTTLTTNYDTDRITMEFTEGSTTVITNGVENDRFRVQLVFDAQNAISHLQVTALQDYNTADEASNQQKLTLKADRVSMEITIVQTNRKGSDWNDGGGNSVDLGQ